MSYCKPCHSVAVRDSQRKNHGSSRSFMLNRRYGIDETTVEWLLLQQNWLCACCRKAPAKHVDHDHKTGAVRGVLCFNCNGALGYVSDDVSSLCRLAAYLEGAGTA